MPLILVVAIAHRQIVADRDDRGELALLRQTQLVLLDLAVAADDVRMHLVGHDDAGKRQVDVRVAVMIDLDLDAGSGRRPPQGGPAVLVEDAGLQRPLQHGDGIDALEPFRKVGEQPQRIRPERRLEPACGHFEARQAAFLQAGDDARRVQAPQLLDAGAIARGQGKRPLFEVGLPITALHRAAATGQRLVQPVENRGLEALVLRRLDDVLVAERMVHVRGQPTGERHRESRRRIVDLDAQTPGTLRARRCRWHWRRSAGRPTAAAASFSFFSRGASFSSISRVRFGAGTSSRTMRPNQWAIGSPSGGAP